MSERVDRGTRAAFGELARQNVLVQRKAGLAVIVGRVDVGQLVRAILIAENQARRRRDVARQEP